jgi:hypothetical protein
MIWPRVFGEPAHAARDGLGVRLQLVPVEPVGADGLCQRGTIGLNASFLERHKGQRDLLDGAPEGIDNDAAGRATPFRSFGWRLDSGRLRRRLWDDGRWQVEPEGLPFPRRYSCRRRRLRGLRRWCGRGRLWRRRIFSSA